MKTKPILFSTPMVRAILDGRKTVTRRIYKTPVTVGDDLAPPTKAAWSKDMLLWVRETWTKWDCGFEYRANSTPDSEEQRKLYGVKWKPSIFMPKTACRIWLHVKRMDITPLHIMTEEDAQAEGFRTLDEFRTLWDKLNDKRGYPWRDNPMVYVIEFKRVEEPNDRA